MTVSHKHGLRAVPTLMPDNSPKRTVLFLTGTRADYGKLLPLIQAVDADPAFHCRIFVTGMHTLKRYGYTVEEVFRSGVQDIHVVNNQYLSEPMDLTLANTIACLARHISELPPDLLVVHGDRVEALAGAIVGSIRNIPTAHIEGGELSGTIDGAIRHAVSKMSHLHFVANTEAYDRLLQLGESADSVFEIGSPDIDVMLSDKLPHITEVKRHYAIDFDRYTILLFHPVTTDIEHAYEHAQAVVDACIASGRRFVVIYPNNDEGSEHIFTAYRRFEGNKNFRVFASIRFEYFLTLLRHADLLVGNSSAGIREAPVYGIPSVDIGNRQAGRFHHSSIIHCSPNAVAIQNAIDAAMRRPTVQKTLHFGEGNSATRFMEVLRRKELWNVKTEKASIDISRLQ